MKQPHHKKEKIAIIMAYRFVFKPFYRTVLDLIVYLTEKSLKLTCILLLL